MRVAVTGSIASDHLMTFAGHFTEQILPDQLHTISLSFLVEDLDVRRGGVAPNICFGMGKLGSRPLLVGAAGEDFGEYRSWLDRHNVDTDSVYISESRHTARFVCTSDLDGNQIASFYAGAMTEASNIELRPVNERMGGLDLILIGANDPAAMVQHTKECRDRGYPFAADPSQQLALLEGEQIRGLVDGAAYLFGNEYEKALIEQKTGWDGDELLNRVGVRVTTLGPKGARVERKGEPPITVGCPAEERRADPTGVGDAFRAGMLSGLDWGLGLERSAEVGCMLATLVIETVGPQEYELDRSSFLERFAAAYGQPAADEVGQKLTV